jgi:hypothetical protein
LNDSNFKQKEKMKKAYLIFITLLLILGSAKAQNKNSTDWGNETRKIIDGKKYRVLYSEIAIDKTIEQVWHQVAMNFINIDQVVKDVISTNCLSGDTTFGLGTKRLCVLKFNGDTTEIKEEIIDFKECGDYREFTYYVYESPDIPIKNYATWVVRKGKDGKTYLGSRFMFRANFPPLTGLIEKKLKKGALRVGVLAYKHFLETGKKNIDSDKLNELYP